MPRVIEIRIAPNGETSVQTKGYSGGECLAASRWLEQALGQVTQDRRTSEFYTTEQEQHQEVQQ